MKFGVFDSKLSNWDLLQAVGLKTHILICSQIYVIENVTSSYKKIRVPVLSVRTTNSQELGTAGETLKLGMHA